MLCFFISPSPIIASDASKTHLCSWFQLWLVMSFILTSSLSHDSLYLEYFSLESRMELFKPTFEHMGPAMRHNFPCPICLENHAVLDMNQGIFLPCWICQKSHWVLKRTDWWNNRSFQSNFLITGGVISGIIAAVILSYFTANGLIVLLGSICSFFIFCFFVDKFFDWLNGLSKNQTLDWLSGLIKTPT